MKNKQDESNEEVSDELKSSSRELLTGGDDIESVSLRIMSATMVLAVAHVSTDNETAENLIQSLGSYCARISIPDFFVVSNLRDSTIPYLTNSPALLLYFKTLNTIFLRSLVSKLNLTYEQLVHKFWESNSFLIHSPAENNILQGSFYLEQKFDEEVSMELMKNNPLLFTVYYFRLAYPLSALSN